MFWDCRPRHAAAPPSSRAFQILNAALPEADNPSAGRFWNKKQENNCLMASSRGKNIGGREGVGPLPPIFYHNLRRCARTAAEFNEKFKKP